MPITPPTEPAPSGNPEMRPLAKPMDSASREQVYWRRNLRIISILMVIWFLVTFGVAYFARDLTFSFFGWPFSFWVGAQGALVVYLLLIGFYAHTMNRLDRESVIAGEE